jgi:putative flavoprotein involved in K+ transport
VAHTTQGRLTARQVVIATGAFHKPFVPTIEGSFGPRVQQLHSQNYRNPASVAGERVLVVGAGNSGLQIAEELNQVRAVVLAASTHPMAFPQRFAGQDLFWWLSKLGLMDKSADSAIARRVRARGDLVIGTDRKQMARAGVEFRPRLHAADDNVATLSDGTTAEVDAVVWCTGFRPDYTWIDADVTDQRGQLRHTRGATKLPGLWVLGLPWQSTRGSSLLGFVQHDAAAIADQISGAATSGRHHVGVEATHA